MCDCCAHCKANNTIKIMDWIFLIKLLDYILYNIHAVIFT